MLDKLFIFANAEDLELWMRVNGPNDQYQVWFVNQKNAKQKRYFIQLNMADDDALEAIFADVKKNVID